MKKFNILLVAILFCLISKSSFAALGFAKVYKVTMSEVRLCTGNSSGTTCEIVVSSTTIPNKPFLISSLIFTHDP